VKIPIFVAHMNVLFNQLAPGRDIHASIVKWSLPIMISALSITVEFTNE